MSADDTIQVDQVEEFRLLTPHNDPSFIILRVKTRDGTVHNFGMDRASLTHTVRVWAFDLGAIEIAIETGAPLPGKQFGSTDKKAS